MKIHGKRIAALSFCACAGLIVRASADSRDGLYIYTQNLESMKSVPPYKDAVLVREGFASSGDGGQATYRWSSSTCSVNGGAGDGGAQVSSLTSKGCWLGLFTAAPNILVWGADSSGRSDSTKQIQAAVDSGVPAVKIPCGVFNVTTILLPKLTGFSFSGEGACSKLKQLPSKLPTIRWDNAKMDYPEGSLQDLLLDGTDGTSDLINTAGVGGETISNLFINNLPVGHSGIVVSGAGDTYTHDVRIDNIQIYSRTAGFAGIRLAPTSSDDEISRVVMNGNFVTRYALYLERRAQTVKFSSSHLYNVANSLVVVTGDSAELLFENDTFDNSYGDVIDISDAKNIIFTHDYFQAIGSSQSGLKLTNSRFVSIFNSIFSGSEGAHSAVTEVGSSDYNQIIGGSLNFSNFKIPFELSGGHSFTQSIYYGTPK